MGLITEVNFSDNNFTTTISPDSYTTTISPEDVSTQNKQFAIAIVSVITSIIMCLVGLFFWFSFNQYTFMKIIAVLCWVLTIVLFITFIILFACDITIYNQIATFSSILLWICGVVVLIGVGCALFIHCCTTRVRS